MRPTVSVPMVSRQHFDVHRGDTGLAGSSLLRAISFSIPAQPSATEAPIFERLLCNRPQSGKALYDLLHDRSSMQLWMRASDYLMRGDCDCVLFVWQSRREPNRRAALVPRSMALEPGRCPLSKYRHPTSESEPFFSCILTYSPFTCENLGFSGWITTLIASSY